MSDRIDLSQSATKNFGSQRFIRNTVAVLIVVLFTFLFAIFSPRTAIIRSSLIGEGCDRTELTRVKCEFVQGDKKLTLRECSEESTCTQSAYKLGKKKDGNQYVVLGSEGFGKSVEVIKIDLKELSQIGSEAAFYTEVKEECKSKENYTKDCFDFPVSEEQLKDIAEQNKKYNRLLKDYSLN